VSNREAPESLRFLAVGAFNTLLGFGAFALIQFLIGAWIGEVLVLVLAHLSVSTIAFFLHRRITFRAYGNLLIDFVRFQSVYIIPVGINLVVLPLLVRVAGMNVYLAQGIITIFSVIVSYFGHKYFSFRRKLPPKPQ
jgi:hypothetical protein